MNISTNPWRQVYGVSAAGGGVGWGGVKAGQLGLSFFI